MFAVNGAVTQIVGIVDRSRAHGSGQDKAVVDINRCMFFDPIMRLIIFDNSVRVKIPGIFFRFSVLVQIAFRRIHFFFKRLDLLIADWVVSTLNKPGIDGDALIDSKSLLCKLPQDFRVNLIHSVFGQSFSEARESRVIRRGFAEG